MLLTQRGKTGLTVDVAMIGEPEFCVKIILIRELIETCCKSNCISGENVDMTELIVNVTIDGVGGDDEASRAW